MILYITGRPDMQKQRVVSWLSQHNFPQGMIFFSDGLVHDPLRQKAIFLRNLMQEVSEGPAVGFQPHPRGRGLSGWPSLAGGGIRPRPPQLLPSSHNQVVVLLPSTALCWHKRMRTFPSPQMGISYPFTGPLR